MNRPSDKDESSVQQRRIRRSARNRCDEERWKAGELIDALTEKCSCGTGCNVIRER